MTTLTLRLNEELKKDFKRVCLENDKTQSDVLKELIEKYIKENKKKIDK